MNRSRPQLVAPRRSDVLIEMSRNLTTGGFDADAFLVMEGRDNTLIAEEILHGAQSSKFVYQFEIAGKEVVGISVVGARHLAAHYGGLKHRLVSSISKIGALHTFQSFAAEGMPMTVNCALLRELAEEDDYYSCVAEITDIKVGNTIQVEARETRYERRRDGSIFERPHYPKIAQAKAYRNAVLGLIPQDLRIKWQRDVVALGKNVVITDSVIDQKRAGILTYCATAGIPVMRDAIDDLTMAQITGLAEAARTKDKELVLNSLAGLGMLVTEGEGAGEESGVEQTPKEPAKRGGKRAAGSGKGDTQGQNDGSQGRPEPPTVDEHGQPLAGASGGQPTTPAANVAGTGQSSAEPTGATGPTGAAGSKRGRMFSRAADQGGQM